MGGSYGDTGNTEKQGGTVVRSLAPRPTRLGSESRLCHLLAVQPPTRHSISLCLNIPHLPTGDSNGILVTGLLFGAG